MRCYTFMQSIVCVEINRIDLDFRSVNIINISKQCVWIDFLCCRAFTIVYRIFGFWEFFHSNFEIWLEQNHKWIQRNNNFLFSLKYSQLIFKNINAFIFRNRLQISSNRSQVDKNHLHFRNLLRIVFTNSTFFQQLKHIFLI